MIINTGLRTDIPAFYSEWFMNRLREGFVCVRNPYQKNQINQYRLDPEVVDCLGFCTKNPRPLLTDEAFRLLKSFHQFWYVTITPYGPEIEPGVPQKEQVIEDFIFLSKHYGPDCVGFRYDPIFLSEVYTLQRHFTEFEEICSKLEGYTKVAVISFIDLYEKERRNFPEVQEISFSERLKIGGQFSKIAKSHGMILKPCAEGDELEKFGADCSGCMTLSTYEKACGYKLAVPVKKSGRRECICLLTCDIGQYDTCLHLCRYCYANSNRQNVLKNNKLHNPNSPVLVGEILPSDKIIVVEQKSWKSFQGEFEF